MSETSKVHILPNGSLTCLREPRAEVIAECERALEMARSGEIQGMAVAYVHVDDCTSTMRAGVMSRALLGCLELIKHKMMRELAE